MATVDGEIHEAHIAERLNWSMLSSPEAKKIGKAGADPEVKAIALGLVRVHATDPEVSGQPEGAGLDAEAGAEELAGAGIDEEAPLLSALNSCRGIPWGFHAGPAM